jgi:tyrosine-specific transport protein
MIYLGTKAVDWFNRLLMLGLIASYAFLIYLGNSHIKTEYLTHSDWSAVFIVIPTMIISFGYHNMIPTLTTYLNRNATKLRITVIVGSLIPLVTYLIWERLILGLVPVEGEGGFREALSQGDMATRALKNAIGSSWVADLAQYFAFFAIVTSFLGVALSFVDFLSDGLHIKKSAKGKVILCALVIVLPFVFALIYPKVFLLALTYAGSFGAVVLFGLLPAGMVWSGRYIKKIEAQRLLPGGKVALAIVIVIALSVIGLQIYKDISTRMFE